MDTTERLAELLTSFKEKQAHKSKLENELRKLQFDKENREAKIQSLSGEIRILNSQLQASQKKVCKAKQEKESFQETLNRYKSDRDSLYDKILTEEQESASFQSQIEKENMDHSKSLHKISAHYYSERVLKLSAQSTK